MFGSTNGSLKELRRGERKAFTSSAQVNPLRFNSSAMQGSPQISAQGISAFASAQTGAMIQRLSTGHFIVGALN
jgi:hypothetical protein